MTTNMYALAGLFIKGIDGLRRMNPFKGFDALKGTRIGCPTDPMNHYEAYCHTHGVEKQAPQGNDGFYAALSQIASRRRAVLQEIRRTPENKPSWRGAFVSRVTDLLLSGLGIVVGAVPFLIIALAIKIDSKGPVLYRQKRVGKGGNVFEMLKFRTMVHHAEGATGPVWATTHDPRITRVGAFLRRAKLDELPQLFNIFLGEMAVVGPRPERPEFVYWFVRYLPAFDCRYQVKPGLTGIAQLRNGYDGDAADVYRKLRWDIQYLKRKCLRTDLWLIYRTLVSVLRRDYESVGWVES